MPSINVDLDFPDHPKTKRLVGQLGFGAEALLLRLWCYTAKYYYVDGRLTGLSADDLEQLIHWRGQKGKAVSALLEFRFLEIDPNGTYLVHDWLDWGKHILTYKMRAKKGATGRERKRHEKGGTDDSNHLEDDDKIILKGSSSLPCIAMQCSEEEEGGCKGEGETIPFTASLREFAQTPAGLAQEFVFYQTAKKEDERHVRQQIEGLMDAGHLFDSIAEQVRCRKNKAERFFHTERRFERATVKETPNGKPAKRPGQRYDPAADPAVANGTFTPPDQDA